MHKQSPPCNLPSHHPGEAIDFMASKPSLHILSLLHFPNSDIHISYYKRLRIICIGKLFYYGSKNVQRLDDILICYNFPLYSAVFSR